MRRLTAPRPAHGAGLSITGRTLSGEVSVPGDSPDVRVADPTISQVLDRYLAVEQGRLKPRTYARYADVIQLLKDCLNSYAPNEVDPVDLERYAAHGYDVASQDPPFCEVFRPAHIPDHLGPFLNGFMGRKVMAGANFLQTAGTVTRKLARWLAQNGYISAAEGERAEARGAAASRDLPAAERLATRLDEVTLGMPTSEADIESTFEVTHVERGRLWLQDFLDGTDYGAVAVPSDVTDVCKIGWQISGALGRHGRGYRLVEAFNVDP